MTEESLAALKKTEDENWFFQGRVLSAS
jgi:hypothetical protein